ncbi:MAG: hypothetical protein KZQ58_05505, partial [gamma proteobacterium symbiont of Bathyaustriella thionipta]|nr:hypothetical protein [gamma proteobacterium symbiont of Bathyaustriella thionipta]
TGKRFCFTAFAYGGLMADCQVDLDFSETSVQLYIEQYSLPFSALIRKVQRKGKRQQAPQLLHSPVLFLSTGNKEVNVLLILWCIKLWLKCDLLVSDNSNLNSCENIINTRHCHETAGYNVKLLCNNGC